MPVFKTRHAVDTVTPILTSEASAVLAKVTEYERAKQANAEELSAVARRRTEKTSELSTLNSKLGASSSFDPELSEKIRATEAELQFLVSREEFLQASPRGDVSELQKSVATALNDVLDNVRSGAMDEYEGCVEALGRAAQKLTTLAQLGDGHAGFVASQLNIASRDGKMALITSGHVIGAEDHPESVAIREAIAPLFEAYRRLSAEAEEAKMAEHELAQSEADKVWQKEPTRHVPIGMMPAPERVPAQNAEIVPGTPSGSASVAHAHQYFTN